MFFQKNRAAFLLTATAFSFVKTTCAESHTVVFTNNCHFGTPLLKQNGNTLSTGETVTFDGPLLAAIAYLDTGSCGANGEGCTLLELTLVNPSSEFSGSSADISLIPPHAFSVTSGFGYFNGCDGAGADCTSATCPTAFITSTTCCPQVACNVDNVDIALTFCD